MNAPGQCPQCGRPLGADAPDGLCLNCLLQLGVAGPPPPTGDETLVLPPKPGVSGAIRYFGDYELIEEIGRGGMGVVYRARQVSLDRAVAVKMILAGPYASEEFLHRFRAEAETIAQLHHPGIVGIYEVGEHEGQPYYAMEYVPGATLAESVRSGPLPPREAARTLVAIARAIQHAHDLGVLHRDLKPSNILIDTQGQPRVTDFGVAKRLGVGPGYTLTGQTLGTPAYIPPEQISTRRGAVTVRSDVYSLGAILYHLLAGRPPFHGETGAETLQAVLDQEPPAPRSINRSIPADLEIIGLRCLAKDAVRRYASAAAFADDLERWLEDKPIQARRVGRAERIWLWAKRKPMAATALGLGAAVLASLLALAVWINIATRLEREAAAAQHAALEMARLSRRRQAERALVDGRTQEATTVLAAMIHEDGSNRAAVSRLVSVLESRRLPRPAAPLLADGSPIYSAAYSPDGARVLTFSPDRQLRLWDSTSSAPLSAPLDHPGSVDRAEFTASGATVTAFVSGNGLFFWDGRTGLSQGQILLGTGASCAAMQPSNHIAAVGFTNGEVVVVDQRARRAQWLADSNPIVCVDYSRDGRWLATASGQTQIKVWSGQAPFPLLVVLAHATNAVEEGHFSPAGRHLFTLGATTNLWFWELPAGRLIARANLPGRCTAAEFSPDSSRLLVGTHNGLVLAYDLESGAEMLRYTNHVGGELSRRVYSLHVSPDGRYALSGAQDGSAQVWDLATGALRLEPIRLDHWVTGVQFAPTGQQFLTTELGGKVHPWRFPPAPPAPLRLNEAEPTYALAFGRSGDDLELLTVAMNGSVAAWNPHTGQRSRTAREASGALRHAEFVGGARWLALADTNHQVTLVDCVSGTSRQIGTPGVDPVLSFDLSRDGRRLAFAAGTNAFVCDAATGRPLAGPLTCGTPQPKYGHGLYRVRLSPDGQQVVTACHEGHAVLWNVASGQVLAEFLHQGTVPSAEFSPDGTSLLTASLDRTAKLWRLTNAVTPVWTFTHRDQLVEARFSPEGRRIVTAAFDGTANLWDTASGARLGEPLAHGRLVHGAQFDAAGKRVVTRSWDGTFRLWDAATGLPWSEPCDAGGRPLTVAIAPDDTLLAVCNAEGQVRIWQDLPSDLPAPGWLPELAEALTGHHLDANGAESEVLPTAWLALERRIAALPATNIWNRWARRLVLP
jgi:WD40 repeat protein